MRIYYLDAPLEDREIAQLRTALYGADAATSFHQVRVPCVLPAADDAAHSDGARARQRRQLAVRHLLRAGLEPDRGQQIGWVLPPDAGWDEIFQSAIRRITGYDPIAIQRWRANDDGTLARAPLCVMDMHGMPDAAASGYRGRQ